MFTVKQTVTIGLESAGKDFDKAALDAAVAAGTPVGDRKIVVTYLAGKPDKDGNPTGDYTLVGDSLCFEPSDLLPEAIAETNRLVAKMFGTIDKAPKDSDRSPCDKYWAVGDPMDVLYILTHSGMRLHNNKAIRDTFAKNPQGKVSDADRTAAILWAQAAKPELLASIATLGFGGLVAAWKAR